MPDAGAPSASASTPARTYGCLTCGVKFADSAAQRAHMKGAWHIANLKRRIASLPPTSAAEFAEQHPSSDAEASSPAFEKSCDACEQHYTSRRAWHAHLRSRNHVQTLAESPAGAEDASSSSSDDDADEQDDDAAASPTQCLFCPLPSTTIESNLSHMSQAHSFFLPHRAHLIDGAAPLLAHLSTLVRGFHECLLCGARKASAEAARDHMRAKGHCRIDLGGDVHELAQFYDFAEQAGGEQDDAPLVLDDGELRLPSGKILGRREVHAKRPPAPSAGQQERTGENEVEAPPAGAAVVPGVSRERGVVMRAGTESSLVGVAGGERRALVAVERKVERMEARARNEYAARVERGGNRQKTFRVVSIGKKAGGLEKRNG